MQQNNIEVSIFISTFSLHWLALHGDTQAGHHHRLTNSGQVDLLTMCSLEQTVPVIDLAALRIMTTPQEADSIHSNTVVTLTEQLNVHTIAVVCKNKTIILSIK